MPIVFYFGALVDDGRNVFSIFKLTTLIFPTCSQQKSSFKKTFELSSVVCGISVIILLIYLLTDKVCNK